MSNKLIVLVISLLSIDQINTSLPFCVLNCKCESTWVNCSHTNIIKVPVIAAQTNVWDLSFNQIINLNDNTFRHLSLLNTLFLNDNQIEKLQNRLFAGLARLTQLYLNNNEIIILEDYSFRNLHNLQELYLNDNKIQTLSDQIFSDLPSIQKIHLQNNKIVYIFEIIFKNNNNLNELSLENNRLVCDCKHFWFKTTKISQLKTSCDLPIHLRDKSVSEISENEFQCKKSENRSKNTQGYYRFAPVFIETPESLIEVETGEDIQLKCLAKGFPEPHIKWTHKKKLNIIYDNKILVIKHIKPLDEGIYECKANNSLGIAVKEVKIMVRGGLLQLNDTNIDDNEIYESFKEAKEIVDQAINWTLNAIRNKTLKYEKISKLMSIARYPLSPESIEFAKSVEIYEKTLEIIKRKVEAKTLLPSIDYKYENVLTPNQLNILAHLSGCLISHRLYNSFDSKICENCVYKKYRTYNGICNNLDNYMWGSSLTPFQRLLPPQYEDGIHLPIGWFSDKKYGDFRKPNARLISQRILSTGMTTDDDYHSHMLMQFGQFIDHDIDFAMPSISFNTFSRELIDCSKTCSPIHPCFSIEIPKDDIRRNLTNKRQRFSQKPQQKCIELIRSSATCGSGLTSVAMGALMPREQVNQLTSFIDASNVYGSTSSLANHLRDKNPRDLGLMKNLIINGKQYLPSNEARLPNDCQQDPRRSDFGCFLAGDVRANEQLGLLSMHTLWLREHNRIAKRLSQINKHWSGEQIYQESRKIVGSEMQFITYYHWLPHILGHQGTSNLGKYKDYNKHMNPSVANVFATAALRFGHTLINPILLRLNETYQPITQFESHLSLHKAFFAPQRLVEEGGIDPLIRGLLFAPSKRPKSDQIMNNQLTEHLFELARDVALDLGAINIQRGRDHGLPSYNDWRKYCNLSLANTFDDLKNEIKNQNIRLKLKQIYGNPNNIDLWVGAVSEDILESAKVGPTFHCLLVEQFRRLRDGDRFYFENSNVLTTEQMIEIKKTSLARIICDNSDNITAITSDVFIQPKHQTWINCQDLPLIDLNKWQNSHTSSNTCNRDNSQDVDIPQQLINQSIN
ncbi:peroxidasin-like [Oppia nitens]|uniref:peroxidasin-like n=1 Tax=Oppia nitens TaxID=1686743 RepID=UPI0023DA71E4|nr:peroxidasin-like [Oppia nitens]